MRGPALLLVSVSVSVAAACTPDRATSEPARELPVGMCLGSPRIDEVRATVDLVESAADEEPSTDVGTPVTVRFAVANRTKSEIVLWRCGFWPNHRVVVHGPKGEVPRALPAGEVAAAALHGERTRNVAVKIPPGGSDAGEAPFDLAALFDLDRPGRYDVRVDYDDELTFVSDVVTFWRLPRGARALLDKLHGWPADEIDAFERPAASPGRVSAGETNGFIATHKAALRALGVDVKWEAVTRRYRVVTAA
jgi:hypothetical protein